MKHEEGRIAGEKQHSIYWQAWLPDKVKAVVLIAHGLGEHGGRYAEVAGVLNGIGCAVYAIDHRGHGKSDGARAFVDRFSNVVADMDQLVDLLRKKHKGKKLFLLGHSMGGALSLSYVLKHQDKLDGLILSGPAVALDGAPPLMRAVSKLLSTFAPGLGVVKIDASLVSRDQSEVAKYDADPLNAHAKVPARTVGEIVKFVEWLPAVLSVIKLPTLLQHGVEDKLAGVSGSRMVHERIASADKTLRTYDGLYHEIYNELPADRAKVFADLRGWVEARAGA